MTNGGQGQLGSAGVVAVAGSLLLLAASCSGEAGRRAGTRHNPGGSGGSQGGMVSGRASGTTDAGGVWDSGRSLDAAAPAADAAASVFDAGASSDTGTAPDSRVASPEGWVFVSMPDWMNNDATYRDPRWTGVFEDGSIGLADFALDAIAAEEPDFVLIAGDLVNGKWGQIDAPLAEREALVQEMGERFMGGMLREFADRQLKVYAAVGDHEVGDNPWSAAKLELVPAYKSNFISHLQMPDNGPEEYRGTTYSLRHENVELFVVDLFEVQDGEMRIGATGVQIAWLERAMAESTADFKLVVGHTPILPGFRARSSSDLEVTDGPESELWDAIVEGDADIYLCGEVHDISFQRRDGVLQLITGTQASNVSEFNYLIATVFPDRIDFEIKSIETTLEGPRDASLDPYGRDKYTQRIVKVSPEPQAGGWQTVGTMTLRSTAWGRMFDEREGFLLSRWEEQL